VSGSIHDAIACYKLLYEEKNTPTWEGNVEMDIKET
jgi:hypothetical protein